MAKCFFFSVKGNMALQFNDGNPCSFSSGEGGAGEPFGWALRYVNF